MRIALVVEIPGVDLDDGAADVAGFRVPGDVIADFEFGWHGGEGMAESAVIRKGVWPIMHPGALCSFQLRSAIEPPRVSRRLGGLSAHAAVNAA